MSAGGSTLGGSFDVPVMIVTRAEHDAMQTELDHLRAENDALRRLASGRGRLLACYRMGTQRGSGTALDMISKAQRDLDALGSDRG